MVPAAHALGALLLEQGQVREATEVFRCAYTALCWIRGMEEIGKIPCASLVHNVGLLSEKNKEVPIVFLVVDVVERSNLVGRKESLVDE